MKNKLIEKSVAYLAEKFGWPRYTRDVMVCMVHNCQGMSSVARLPAEKRRAKRRELDELESRTTLRNVLDFLEKEYVYNYHHHFHQKYLSFLRKFVALGLTRLDSIIMPQKTVTVEMLKKLSKKELLALDARVLGTLSTINLEHRMDIDRKHFFTVEELLQRENYCYSKHEERAVGETIALLKELGFKYEDGLFMQGGTRRKLIENLMQKDNISQKEATSAVIIAEKQGWVKSLIE